jgi:hypothetical protein
MVSSTLVVILKSRLLSERLLFFGGVEEAFIFSFSSESYNIWAMRSLIAKSFSSSSIYILALFFSAVPNWMLTLLAKAEGELPTYPFLLRDIFGIITYLFSDDNCTSTYYCPPIYSLFSSLNSSFSREICPSWFPPGECSNS